MALTVSTASVALADSDGPTCDNAQFDLGAEVGNHGDHVITEYVEGDKPGGPGPGEHFGIVAPPGASFCTGANSGAIYSNPTGNGRPLNP